MKGRGMKIFKLFPWWWWLVVVAAIVFAVLAAAGVVHPSKEFQTGCSAVW